MDNNTRGYSRSLPAPVLPLTPDHSDPVPTETKQNIPADLQVRDLL